MLVHPRATTGTDIYTWVKKDNVGEFSCLRKQHDGRDWESNHRSEVQRANHHTPRSNIDEANQMNLTDDDLGGESVALKRLLYSVYDGKVVRSLQAVSLSLVIVEVCS